MAAADEISILMLKKPSRFKQLFCVTRNCEFACSLRFEGFLKTEVLKIIWRLAPTRLKNIKFEMPWLFQSQGTEAHFLSIRERNDPGLDVEEVILRFLGSTTSWERPKTT